MKKLLLFTLLFAGLTAAKGQTPISYSEVVQVEGATKDELYQRAKNWFADMFRSANDVIQLDDKETGQLTGRGNIASYEQPVAGFGLQKVVITFKISVYQKDGRYRYDLSDFSHSARYIGQGSRGETNNIGLLTTLIPEVVENMESYLSVAEKKEGAKDLYDRAISEIDENTKVLITSLKKAMSTPTETQSDDW